MEVKTGCTVIELGESIMENMFPTTYGGRISKPFVVGVRKDTGRPVFAKVLTNPTGDPSWYEVRTYEGGQNIKICHRDDVATAERIANTLEKAFIPEMGDEWAPQLPQNEMVRQYVSAENLAVELVSDLERAEAIKEGKFSDFFDFLVSDIDNDARLSVRLKETSAGRCVIVKDEIEFNSCGYGLRDTGMTVEALTVTLAEIQKSKRFQMVPQQDTNAGGLTFDELAEAAVKDLASIEQRLKIGKPFIVGRKKDTGETVYGKILFWNFEGSGQDSYGLSLFCNGDAITATERTKRVGMEGIGNLIQETVAEKQIAWEPQLPFREPGKQLVSPIAMADALIDGLHEDPSIAPMKMSDRINFIQSTIDKHAVLSVQIIEDPEKDGYQLVVDDRFEHKGCSVKTVSRDVDSLAVALIRLQASKYLAEEPATERR